MLVDRDKLKITLTRSACFGSCPDYAVTIDGHGNVTFVSVPAETDPVGKIHREYSFSTGIAVPGTHRARVDPAQVDALLAKFQAANFFSLKNGYQAGVTDNPTYTVEIDTGRNRKHVVDYVGGEVGMPKAVTELENAIDVVAGSARWVSGANGLIDQLASEHFDFRAEAASRILLASIENGGDETLAGLINRGAPLNQIYGGKSYGERALDASIRYGRAPLFTLLAERGWLERMPPGSLGASFADAGGGCSPALVDAALSRNIDVRAVTVRNPNDLDAKFGQSALATLVSGYACDEDEPRRRTTTLKLLAVGVDPNSRDNKGESAIFGVEDLTTLNILLAHGADARLKDNEGNSAVFGSWTDDIVLRLLQAGASPQGHYWDGKTLLEQMKDRPMPKAKAWLDAHPDALTAPKH